jgi:hypothetical protein
MFGEKDLLPTLRKMRDATDRMEEAINNRVK